MPTTANFEIYLQALGGKFIGQNAFEPAQINVHVFVNGAEHPLPYFSGPNKTTPDDGEVSPAFVDGLSTVAPILTNQPTKAVVPVAVHFLTPQPGITVVAKGAIDLTNANETAELVVYYPIPGPNNTVKTLTIRQPVVLNAFQLNYRFTVLIPGLLVHTPVLSGNQVAAVVTMMCGCRVSNGSTPPYWLPADFTVVANVVYKDKSIQQLPLSLLPEGTSSTFAGTLPGSAGIESVTVLANQKSTGNFGFNRINFKDQAG
jgi:hypothetical protein